MIIETAQLLNACYACMSVIPRTHVKGSQSAPHSKAMETERYTRGSLQAPGTTKAPAWKNQGGQQPKRTPTVNFVFHGCSHMCVLTNACTHTHTYKTKQQKLLNPLKLSRLHLRFAAAETPSLKASGPRCHKAQSAKKTCLTPRAPSL